MFLLSCFYFKKKLQILYDICRIFYNLEFIFDIEFGVFKMACLWEYIFSVPSGFLSCRIPPMQNSSQGIPPMGFRGRNSNGEESYVGKILCGRNPIWEEFHFRNPVWEESCVEGILCGRNPMGGIPFGSNPVGRNPMGGIPLGGIPWLPIFLNVICK